MDKEKLDYWKMIIMFFYNVLGDNYEIVLYVVDENDIYIGELVNSYISGWIISLFLMIFVFDLIKNKVYKEKDFVINYKVIVSFFNKEVCGFIFFIKNV